MVLIRTWALVVRVDVISSPVYRSLSSVIPVRRTTFTMAPSEGHSADASTTATTSPSKLRHRTRILAAQNDTAHPRIDNILASKEQEHSDSSTIHPREEHQPEAKAVSTARPTSPLMPIVRSLERLSEKVPSLPKLPASNIEVKYVLPPT